MGTLVTTAVIRASDQLTGPLAGIAARVKSANAGFKSSAAAAATAGRTLGAGLGVGLFSIGAMLDKAQEFNKAIFGIGAGQVIDEKTGQAQVARAREDMAAVTKTSLDMSKAMGFSASKIAEIQEVFVKAGLKEGLTDITKASVTLSKADTETPAKNIADFMHTLTQLYDKDYKKGPGDFIRRQADMILTAADQTKLSVGSIMEGMRQFQTVGANLGLKTEDMLPMMMAGAQLGFGASEFGTAMKSDFGRLLKLTGPGASVMSRLGIDLTNDRFTKGATVVLEGANALRNLNNAMRQYGGVKGKLATQVGTMLEQGARNPNLSKDALVDQISNVISRAKGKTTDKDRAAIRREVQASILGKNGELNPIEVLRAMEEKGASQADYDVVFEGRHSARNAALRKAIAGGPNSQYAQWKQLLERMHGQGLDAVETLWSDSPFGNLEAMKAAWERLIIRMANTPAIQAMVNGLENIASAAEKIPAKWALIAGGAAVFAMLAGPVKTLVAGLWGMASASAAAALGMVRMGAAAVFAPFAAAATAMAGMASAMRAVGAAGLASMFTGLGGVATVLGGITVGLVGLTAALAALAVYNTDWEKALGTAEANRMKSAFEDLQKSARGLAGDIDALISKMGQWLGMDVSGGPKGWDKLWSMLREDAKMFDRMFNFLRGNGYKTTAELEEAERNGEVPQKGINGEEYRKKMNEQGFDPATGMPLTQDIGQQIRDGLTGTPMKIENLTEDGIASKTSNPIVGALQTLIGAVQNIKINVNMPGGAANAPTPASPNPGSYRGQ